MPQPCLQGYYLTRVYREGSDPFAVISDLPRDRAVELCSRFAPHRQVGDGSGGQDAYMDARVETENWLRDAARQSGVDIRRQNPVYFVLTRENQEQLAPTGKRVVSFRTEDLDLSCCSFTFGDSIGNRTSTAPEGPHPLNGVVMNAQQMEKILETDYPEGDYLRGGRYIEVQMWAHPDKATAPAKTVSAPAKPNPCAAP